ncbi:F-box protein [Panicum miliaceum]|uniref:F-box protein n=1 Tax=Panicum miliaceum TaxID=4540 RepID=A0A3L6T8K3_PANMI|nr:F-box protein [Panicum miliaceum]
MADATPRSRQPPSWADIPRDLAGMVLRLLPACADRARFAAVCPQWRAAARELPLPPPLPLLALPDGTFYSLPHGKPFRFPGVGCAGYKSACGGRWLVFPRDDGCFLVDPFAGATVTLPPLSRVRLLPPNAVAKYVDLPGVRMFHPYATWMHIQDPEKMPVINKMILCSPNLVAAFAGSTLVGAGNNSQIIVCQPGASSWSVRANDKCELFEDMAFYQGKLYALANDENLLVVNISQDPTTGDPQISRIGKVIKSDLSYPTDMPDDANEKKKLYLVELGGALLKIRRKVCCRRASETLVAGQSEFEVFKADLEHSQWVNVTTLGDDHMLFLGRPCSRAISASQYGMPGDQIFFLDDVMENCKQYSYDEETTSVSVYNMRSGEVSSPLPIIWKHEMILATWLFPWD